MLLAEQLALRENYLPFRCNTAAPTFGEYDVSQNQERDRSNMLAEFVRDNELSLCSMRFVPLLYISLTVKKG